MADGNTFAPTQAVGTPLPATNTLVGALQKSTAQQKQIRATDKNSQRAAETAQTVARIQVQSAAAGQAAETERNSADIAAGTIARADMSTLNRELVTLRGTVENDIAVARFERALPLAEKALEKIEAFQSRQQDAIEGRDAINSTLSLMGFTAGIEMMKLQAGALENDANRLVLSDDMSRQAESRFALVSNVRDGMTSELNIIDDELSNITQLAEQGALSGRSIDNLLASKASTQVPLGLQADNTLSRLFAQGGITIPATVFSGDGDDVALETYAAREMEYGDFIVITEALNGLRGKYKNILSGMKPGPAKTHFQEQLRVVQKRIDSMEDLKGSSRSTETPGSSYPIVKDKIIAFDLTHRGLGADAAVRYARKVFPDDAEAQTALLQRFITGAQNMVNFESGKAISAGGQAYADERLAKIRNLITGRDGEGVVSDVFQDLKLGGPAIDEQQSPGANLPSRLRVAEPNTNIRVANPNANRLRFPATKQVQ